MYKINAVLTVIQKREQIDETDYTFLFPVSLFVQFKRIRVKVKAGASKRKRKRNMKKTTNTI